MKINEIAELINGEVSGDDNLEIIDIASIDRAKEGEISFIYDIRQKEQAEKSNASCVIVPEEIEELNKTIIRVNNVRLAVAKIMRLFYKDRRPPQGISDRAIINDNVKLGKNITICENVFIDSDTTIGNEVIIYPNVYVGKEVIISDNTLIYPNVTIMDNVSIGKEVIIHPGCVIGSDGFGYVQDKNKKHFKIPQRGKVIIEDNVEIGANCCIDRGMLDETVIGEGTKIDNLVQVGHNVKIGKNCIIVAQVGIAGSVIIGNNVTLAGQVGIKDHVTIGDNVIVAGQAGVMKNIPANSIYSGYPAREHKESKRLYAYISMLPKLYERVKKLESCK